MSFTRRKALFAAGMLAAIPTAGAAAEPVRRPTAAAEVWSRTELYFGTDRVSLPPVSDAEFQLFVEQEVTPRFPDGLTLLTGLGQFRTSSGNLVREKSFVMVLFYPQQMMQANKYIQEIRDHYKTRFNQESVLRSDNFSYVSF